MVKIMIAVMKIVLMMVIMVSDAVDLVVFCAQNFTVFASFLCSCPNNFHCHIQFKHCSCFLPGYYPSNAFDNNPETIWVSNGQAPPGMQWIAFEFDHPVAIASIRVASEIDKPERAPTEIYVEGSCEKYFRTFETMWILRNPMQKSDIRVHGEVKRRDAGKPRFRRYR